MEIKDAVQQTVTFAKTSLGPKRASALRLEEIESSTADGRPVWLITLSSDLPKARSPLSSFSPLAVTIGADSEREYKVFAVAKDNEDVLSMKIRLLAVPTF